MSELSNKKNYLWSVTSNLGVTVTRTVTGLATVPIGLAYWDTEKYGLFAVISSLVVYLSVANFGLHQVAAVLMSKSQSRSFRLRVFGRTSLLTSLTAVGFLAGFVVFNVFSQDWVYFLGQIPPSLWDQAYWTTVAVAAFYFVNMPFALLTAYFQGTQKLYVENLFSIVNVLVAFGVLLITIALKGDLVLFAILNGSSMTFLGLIKLAVVRFHFIPRLGDPTQAPNLFSEEEIQESTYRGLLISGTRYLSIGLAGTVVFNIDNFLLSNVFGFEAVTPYAVTYRLFSVLFGVVALVASSIFPLIAREFGKGNWSWVNARYQEFSGLFGLLGGAIWVGGILFGRDIIGVWAGPQNYGGLWLVFFLGGYAFLFSRVSLDAGIVQVLNYVKGTVWVYWLEVLLKVGFSLALMPMLGIAGVGAGMFLGSLFSVAWFLPAWLAKQSGHAVNVDVRFLARFLGFILVPALVGAVAVQVLVNDWLARVALGSALLAVYVVGGYFLLPGEARSRLDRLVGTVLRVWPKGRWKS